MASISWRTGVNMREFAYYDKPECRIYQDATPPTREAQIAAQTVPVNLLVSPPPGHFRTRFALFRFRVIFVLIIYFQYLS